MNNMISVIKILFKDPNPQEILRYYFELDSGDFVDNDLFISMYTNYKPLHYSRNEVQNLRDIFQTKWSFLEGRKNRFHVLYNFTKHILTNNRGQPEVVYKELLKWRMLSMKVGEDLLTTSFLAYDDYIKNYDRTIFAWKPIVSTNNKKLTNILSKGFAENHFHLYGSSHHFQISWISLMNYITNRDKDFKKLEKEKKLHPDNIYVFEEESLNISNLVKKAAYIRYFLYEKIIKNNDICLNQDLLKTTDKNEIKLFLQDIQREINLLRFESKKFGKDSIDYLIPKNISSNNINYKNIKNNANLVLYGERYFLYTVFQKIYKNEDSIKQYEDLFYAYIVIKEKFRNEFVQLNEKVGFENFQKYQDRKSYFIKKEIYQSAVVNMAINSSLNDQSIKSLEARFKPNNSFIKNIKRIEDIDKQVDSEIFFDDKNREYDNFLKEKKKNVHQKHFFVTHFIKKPEHYNEKNKYKLMLKPLNYKVREEVEKEAKAIINLRKSNHYSKSRILGIDAASSEVGCRPEAFAQAFRFLRFYKIKNSFEIFDKPEIFNLGITFHAGEDFLGIVDGLRYIDETVRFLNYKQGDRIGHALALGIDPKDFYRKKEYTIALPKQVYLDNIAWMLQKIMEFDIETDTSVISKLKNDFHKYFNEIYDGEIKHQIGPEDYYQAWKLRGDNPELYKGVLTGVDNKEQDYNKPAITFWQKCAKDFEKDNELKALRDSEKIKSIYANYHYNVKVREKGLISTEVKVNDTMIYVVKQLQTNMQKLISSKNISIETNPSSNFVIGSFKRYEKHPIFSFYNMGLENDSECSLLDVSINTDDQGVFVTSLENEYALLSLALEKNKDKNYTPNQIYDWIDRVREMGIGQSFYNQQIDYFNDLEAFQEFE